MKIFRAVERGIEIPENLDDLVIPEETKNSPEEASDDIPAADQTRESGSDLKENTVTLDKTKIQ